MSDVAEILNLSVAEVGELLQSAELPAIRVGGRWRIERDVLESYIEAKYEESRRMGLWHQSQFADIPELSIGPR